MNFRVKPNEESLWSSFKTGGSSAVNGVDVQDSFNLFFLFSSVLHSVAHFVSNIFYFLDAHISVHFLPSPLPHLTSLTLFLSPLSLPPPTPPTPPPPHSLPLNTWCSEKISFIGRAVKRKEISKKIIKKTFQILCLNLFLLLESTKQAQNIQVETWKKCSNGSK